MTVNELLAICKEVNYLEKNIGSSSFDDLEEITMRMRLKILLNTEVGKLYDKE